MRRTPTAVLEPRPPALLTEGEREESAPELRAAEAPHLGPGDPVLHRVVEIGVRVAVVEDSVREVRRSSSLAGGAVALGAAEPEDLLPLGDVLGSRVGIPKSEERGGELPTFRGIVYDRASSEEVMEVSE
jgi:hypothetical protein